MSHTHIHAHTLEDRGTMSGASGPVSKSNKPSGNDTEAIVVSDDPQFSLDGAWMGQRGTEDSHPLTRTYFAEKAPIYYLPCLLVFFAGNKAGVAIQLRTKSRSGHVRGSPSIYFNSGFLPRAEVTRRSIKDGGSMALC